MTAAYRSGIKGTFAIYSGNNDHLMPLPAPPATDHRFSSPLPIEEHFEKNGSHSSREVDPLVLVVQLKKELDDERRRFEHEREDLQAALAAAKNVARREAETLREAVREAEAAAKRTQEDVESERSKKRDAETAWAGERRSLKDETERVRGELRAKEDELQDVRDRLQADLAAVEAKAGVAAEALQKEHAARVGREAVAEQKFAALRQQLAAAAEAREVVQRTMATENAQWRRELDEARMRHSEVCQQVMDMEKKSAQLQKENHMLSEELEAAFAAAEDQKNRLESEWRAHLSAELTHAREEASQALEDEQRAYRTQVKNLEADYRARLDEAKQRLVSILRQKKAKYVGQRTELEERLRKAQHQLKAEQKEAADLRARLARMLGRASGIIEDHCSSTKRLISDGHDSVASIYSGPREDDRNSLLSESWSLPAGVDRLDSPSTPFAPRYDP